MIREDKSLIVQLKKLEHKMKKLEREYIFTGDKRVLRRARIMRCAQHTMEKIAFIRALLKGDLT
jgi:hypothetical protein